MNYVVLDHCDPVIAANLLLINEDLLLALGLGLARSLGMSAARRIAQLLLVGLVLEALRTSVSPLWTGLAVVVMLLFSGCEVMARQKLRLKGFWSFGLGAGATFPWCQHLRGDPAGGADGSGCGLDADDQRHCCDGIGDVAENNDRSDSLRCRSA